MVTEEKNIRTKEEIRQILAMANFESREEAANTVAALHEAQRYGCSVEAILNRIITRSRR